MVLKKSVDYFRVLLYLLFGLSMLFLRFLLNNGEPFALALVYALGRAGLSPYLSAFLFVCTAVVDFELSQCLLYALQALLLCIGFAIRTRLYQTDARAKEFPALFMLALALGAFVAAAPFTPYPLPFAISLPDIAQKTVIGAFIFLLSAAFAVGLKGLLHKFLHCRLRADELTFCLLFFILTGVGLCRLFGFNAYMGVAFFVLLAFSYVTKDATACVCAFVLALPPFLALGFPPNRFFIYGVMLTLFSKSGRLATACSFLCVFFLYAYADGTYALQTAGLVQAVLSAVIPALCFVLLPTPFIRELENKLVFYREKHLPRIAINRNRAMVGQQLFEISAVFKEIEATFGVLGATGAEEGAQEHIRALVVANICMRKKVQESFLAVIKIGCAKGKASLIDLPKPVADYCVRQSDVLYAINTQIGEYRKYMLETENASAGRALLARQAQGVSEILKNLALEQSEPLKIYTQLERQLNSALLQVGIVCSEVLICGNEDDVTLSLISYGKADVKKISAVASHILATELTISKRLTLGNDKFCCILRKKPLFDAAFGVATATKNTETASGDTHSVIKIDERRFLVALADGMGSGEYARRISESTISLLESFYRAKMPQNTVLSTVNKLLTFSAEETFACVDIAVVDLTCGRVDLVKIGSPVGFILSNNTVKVLENGSLPLGILDALRPTTNSYELCENDVLLFLSDGVTDAFGSAGDLYDVLKTLSIRNPQQLAENLLQKALENYGGVAKDDMTALAVRLFRAS